MVETRQPAAGSDNRLRRKVGINGAVLPAALEGVDVVARTEERLARMIAYARGATTAFIYIPLSGWGDLQRPVLAVTVAVAATGYSAWFVRRAWRRRTLRDPVLVTADVAFCVALMVAGSRAAFPDDRNSMMTELVPFSLVASATLGFGAGLAVPAVCAVMVMIVAWVLAVIPDISQKLGSDILGFVLWYVVALLIARELRTLSRATQAAQAAAAEIQRLVADQERQAESARQREIAHREIHDYLLPIIDHVAAGGTATPALALAARRGGERARRMTMDPRSGDRDLPGFEALVADIIDLFTEEGMALVPVVTIRSEPPDDVGEALAAATREALRNVARHAQSSEQVNLFVEAGEDGVEVVVRDRGAGFDPASTAPGGGFAGTYRAVERHGGTVSVSSRPGEGTKVVFRWLVPESPDDDPGDSSHDSGHA